MFNGVQDVVDALADFDDGKRVKMVQGDRIDLAYACPIVPDGYERGFIVALQGYYHADPLSREKPVVDEWIDMDCNAIIQALYDMGETEAINALPRLFWLSELVDSLYGAPLEQKIQTAIVENVLPWLYGEK